ncbi:MAG: LysR family transcriptional regulator [Pseudomonadota bacterium]
MSLPPLPLTKLITLRGLLETESVSETARRLRRAQPSITATLGELRDYYGDALLVRDGARMRRSAFGEMLLPHLNAFAGAADDLLSLRPDFDPARDKRLLRVAATDYQATLIAKQIGFILNAAPYVDLDIRPMGPAEDAVKSGLASLALHSGAEPPAAFKPRLLANDTFCVLYDPAGGAPPATREDFAARTFIQASPSGARGGAVDDALAQVGLARRVRATVAPLSLAPRLIAGTENITVLPKSLVSALEMSALRTAPLPFHVDAISTWIMRSRRTAGDKAIDWIVATLSSEQ